MHQIPTCSRTTGRGVNSHEKCPVDYKAICGIQCTRNQSPRNNSLGIAHSSRDACCQGNQYVVNDRSLIATAARSLRNDDSENVTPKCKFLIFGKETKFFLLSRCYYKMNLHSLTTKLERVRKRERTVKIKLYFLSGPPQDVT